MSVDIVDVFCETDDFCKGFEEKWVEQLISDGKIKRVAKGTLSMSEVMRFIAHNLYTSLGNLYRLDH